MLSVIDESRSRLTALVLVPASIMLALLLLSAASTVSSASNAAPPGQSSATATPSPTPSRTILLTDPVADPRLAGVQYLAPTGHTLRGAFLDYWNKYGGLAQFGYPTTEEFVEPVDANATLTITVQYFQRNRFEHHPENKDTQYEVLLGTLGREFHTQDPSASPLPATIYFKETGHNLGGAFKQYWDTHGGLFVHGYPITEQYQEKNPIDGKTYMVQYFERSRFELHPENKGTPYEVLLGLLGTQSAQQKGYFIGAYPRYGHAVDYSWVAGQVLFYARPECSQPECGCSILGIQQDKVRLQLTGPSWFRYSHSRQVLHTFLVAFGHLLVPAEIYHSCPLDDAHDYFVDQVQANPVQ